MSSHATLAISLFFHLSATVVWIGGLVITSLLVWPEMRRTLEDQPALYNLLNRLRKRFIPLSNLSLATLIVTGLFQMSLDSNYNGVLNFDNTWAKVMLAKHLVILVMALTGLFLQYVVVPALERTSVLVERGKGDMTQWKILRQREIRLTWVSVGLGVMVLGLSAWAGSI